MVSKLDLSRDRGTVLPWVGAGVLLVIAALLVVVMGAAVLVLIGCLVAGAGLTYLSGLSLRMDERVAYGALIGPIAFSALTFLLALAAGLQIATVAAGLGGTIALGGIGWWRGRDRFAGELEAAAGRWARGEPWPLWLLLAVCWSVTLVLLSRAYQVTPQGLLVGNVGVYADWAAHLTFASSFAYGANFPPQFPIYPGHGMTYPFMVDFWAATLVPLGASVTSALVLTSGMLGLAFPAVLYFAWVRLAGDRLAAAVAVFLFVLSGGLGFLLLLGGAGPVPDLLTQDLNRNLVWLNPVLAWMLPQRSVLFGFALVPLGLGLLWSAREKAGWAPFAFTGVLAGLAPLFHLHAFGTLVALAAFWALIDLWRARPGAATQWAAFFLPALALGAPVAVWMASGGAAALHLQPGWLAGAGGHHDNWLWFWIWNTGLLVPLLLAAMLWPRLLPRDLLWRLAPIWLWFLVPNFVVLQIWDWDNTKFFAYWALVAALPVGLLLVRWGRDWRTAPLAAILFVSLTLSGAMDLGRALDQNKNTARFTDAGGIRAADWTRENTDPHAIFLVAPAHNQPIPCLAGRSAVAGYPGWLWSYGFTDWEQRSADAQRMLQGGTGTAELVRKYHVAYVVIGPQELSPTVQANAAYWQSSAQRVYSDDGYTIYRTRAA